MLYPNKYCSTIPSNIQCSIPLNILYSNPANTLCYVLSPQTSNVLSPQTRYVMFLLPIAGEEQDLISVGENGVLKDATFDMLDLIMDEHHTDAIVTDDAVVTDIVVTDAAMADAVVTDVIVTDHGVNGEDVPVDRMVDGDVMRDDIRSVNNNDSDRLVENHATTTTTTASVPFQTTTSTSVPLTGDSTAKMTTEASNHLPISTIPSQELSSLQQGKRQLLSHFLCHLTDSGTMIPLCLYVVCILYVYCVMTSTCLLQHQFCTCVRTSFYVLQYVI